MQTKIRAWAIKDDRERFVRSYTDSAFHTRVFKTQREANQWIQENPYWIGKGTVKKVVITIKEAFA